MRINGFDLEIVRSETASVAYTLMNEDNTPFIVLTTDMYQFLDARFTVKKDGYSRNEEDYPIDFLLSLANVKRFSDAAIIDILSYYPTFNPLLWDDSKAPLAADINRLFYHPGVGDYRYYNGTRAQWVPYSVVVTVPFKPSDTENLEYREYFYDLSIEAGTLNPRTVEYRKMLIPQHSFTVSYKV